jgi:hypothetical protein
MEKRITENREQLEKKIIGNKEDMKINMEQMERKMDENIKKKWMKIKNKYKNP